MRLRAVHRDLASQISGIDQAEGKGHVAAGQLLRDFQLGTVGEPEPATLGRRFDPGQPGLGRRPQRLDGLPPRALPCRRIRLDHFTAKAAGSRKQIPNGVRHRSPGRCFT
jgi:hypothetical protein